MITQNHDFQSVVPLAESIHILANTTINFGWLVIFTFLLLHQYSGSAFRSLEFGQKLYVAKNTAKSVVLFALIPSSFWILVSYFMGWPVDPTAIRTAGTIYASTDIYGLLVMKNLMWSTKLHHLVVTCVGVLNMCTDITIHGPFKGFQLYGAFSSFTFLVNTTLAFRHILIDNHPRPLKTMYDTSFVTYACVCLINWGTQIHLLKSLTGSKLLIALQVVLLVVIISDDIYLLNWLKKRSSFNEKKK
jgi:hypothetical protein